MAEACIYASLAITTDESEMQKLILDQYAEYINQLLNDAYDNISRSIKDKVKELILTSPVSEALISGDLRKNLGIKDGASIVSDIAEAIVDSMEFTIDKPMRQGSNIVGGYTIKISRGDFQDILSVDGTSFTTSSGIEIPWLRWLLFSGDSEIIYGYRLELNPDTPQNSRTGAIMVKTPGESWGIPSQYAGTISDNFITQALFSLEEEIPKMIMGELG